MCPVHVSLLPQNKPKKLTEAELRERRDAARQRLLESKQQKEQNLNLETITSGMENISTEKSTSTDHKLDPEELPAITDEESDYVFVAFARIFSGTLKSGMKLYCLSPKYDPRKYNLFLNNIFRSFFKLL